MHLPTLLISNNTEKEQLTQKAIFDYDMNKNIFDET